MTVKLGVLGVGDLTEKMVRGLRRGASDIDILLSQRNRTRAERLAREFGCRMMADNQVVADAADVVLVGVRPAQLRDLATTVRLKDGQLLVSVVGGVPVETLVHLFGSRACCRAMLSAASEINRSTVAIYPSDSAVGALLGSLGNVVRLTTKRDFELAMVSACMNGWFYFLVDELHGWFEKKGLPAESARQLVFSTIEDCVAYSRHKRELSAGQIGEAIAVPGTYTELGLKALRGLGATAGWSIAADKVFEQLMEQILPSCDS
ncbi:NAD(P)-binding domain-containing protein [Burkholderia multivorans]|uniref:NAD(P)-binding domain-containing protein n=1 Tax=Burkholderia multivorans TaxID=87883 RepID=UPI002018CDB3|nr:NAD(P)-binding domain-containing protein [Burkholderia multivorans]MCO1368634.1 NAD(P)-binding domain-containing protein [Burkholderia multivorans]MCO1380525.1 NAD(P)-binding domain-containing protein [Burkholderia multivorans]MDN8032410.1 NAD(P)-binding domain-containing protein [Burkholderia multivorans]UQP22047.1 NAD(P)-binding domain-containing protein [Burkholderia multivorans]UQP91505.1 NAD(P)-binding domain-containing protein [Burkholderia multivorans]